MSVSRFASPPSWPRAQRHDGDVKPLFRTAGGLATVNVLIAVLRQ